MKIYDKLKKKKISIDHLDINMLKPFKLNLLLNSVKKTGKLLILDNSVHKYCSFGSYLISELISNNKNIFKKEPLNLNLPDIPSPTSFHLTKSFYHSSDNILKHIGKLTNTKFERKSLNFFHDLPDPDFRGPF